MSHSSNSLTKEQLLACLEQDGIEVDVTKINNKRKKNDGAALFDVGWQYQNTEKDYSKALAWYRLAENQNYSPVYNNIGVLYANGLGVPQDFDIALEYYLKAAGNNSTTAMENIGYRFFTGTGMPLDKYKALEWYIKCGIKPEKVEELNKQGVHLKDEDKKKTVYQLIIEAENLIREERKKEKQEYQRLKKLNISNEKKLKSLRKDNQKLQQKQQRIDASEDKELSKQTKNILTQQLKDKEENINSLKREIEVYKSLVQSKDREIDMLIKDHQRERENMELKRQIEESRRYSQEPTLFMASSSNDNNATRHGSQTSHNSTLGNNVDNVFIKTEPDSSEESARACLKGNKKRKMSSSRV